MSSTPSSTPSTSRRVADSSPEIQHTRPRLRSLHQEVEMLYYADDRVLGRWKDGQWYPGTIKEVFDNGKYNSIIIVASFIDHYAGI